MHPTCEVSEAATTNEKFTHVVFSYPMEVNVTVPLSEAFDWCDKQSKGWEPERVIHRDGFSSWAKGWKAYKGGGVWALVRIGSGAYGDGFVADRQHRFNGWEE